MKRPGKRLPYSIPCPVARRISPVSAARMRCMFKIHFPSVKKKNKYFACPLDKPFCLHIFINVRCTAIATPADTGRLKDKHAQDTPNRA